MNLYLLSRREPAGYDEAGGFVVCASTEEKARNVASLEHGDEGKDTWLRDYEVSCELLASDVEVEAGIVLRDFHAG